jgi:hypothetical protein
MAVNFFVLWNQEEVKEQFENILEENDWFEMLCYEPIFYAWWQ